VDSRTVFAEAAVVAAEATAAVLVAAADGEDCIAVSVAVATVPATKESCTVVVALYWHVVCA
jgi:hypothetical protein